ncbi:MAG: glycosyltransferase family 39 protein [Candidatus Omnitrophica bacterium]|nr:glycosyltransferase family 39 protein [Candidatus Omnitrophota bacterium]
MPMPGLQEWIHKFEEGEGVRLIKKFAVALALLALVIVYNVRQGRNFLSAEAMDAAQLARNIAEGKGFTTQFVRPLSIFLVQKSHTDKNPMLDEGHPDLANAPLYPLMLAGLMKVLPFNYYISTADQFSRYQPELLISLLNQVWFLLAVVLVFLLAKKLFDPGVAWLAAGVFTCTDLFWRFSVSGLPTLFLADLFLGIVWCLMRLEQGTREEGHGQGWFLGWALACGLLLGLGCLTRYAFGWLILPVILFLVLFVGPRRATLVPTACIAFALLLTPWLVRNYQVGGTLFGTAGYALWEDTTSFPGSSLERSIQPDPAQLNGFNLGDIRRKLTLHCSTILSNDLFKLGGTWFSAFFLVGLLVPFRSPTLSRLRIFLLLCLASLTVAQALGQTDLSRAVPDVNSENLLVLVVPLVFIFSAAMYHLLVDQLELPFPTARRWLTGLVGLLACLPFVFSLLSPRNGPIVYPPYYPWLI